MITIGGPDGLYVIIPSENYYITYIIHQKPDGSETIYVVGETEYYFMSNNREALYTVINKITRAGLYKGKKTLKEIIGIYMGIPYKKMFPYFIFSIDKNDPDFIEDLKFMGVNINPKEPLVKQLLQITLKKE